MHVCVCVLFESRSVRVCVCFDAGIFACLSRKLCVAHKQKRKPRCALLWNTFWCSWWRRGCSAGAGALWELRLSRLPGCLFFNAPPSLLLSLTMCRVLLPAHFVFRSEPEIIIATWRCPHPAQRQQRKLWTRTLAKFNERGKVSSAENQSNPRTKFVCLLFFKNIINLNF